MRYTVPKVLLLSLATLLLGLSAAAQAPGVVISDETNPAPADSSALLELRSTGAQRQGFLLPRMTQEQREAITKPAQGLMVFQTDKLTGAYLYLGNRWVKLLYEEITNPGPVFTISGVTPLKIRPGDTLFITGSGLNEELDYLIGNSFLNVISADGNSVVVVAEAVEPGIYQVSALYTNGNDTLGRAVAPDFVVVINPLPSVSGFNPAEITEGTPTKITFYGRYFDRVSNIYFGTELGTNLILRKGTSGEDTLCVTTPALQVGTYDAILQDGEDYVSFPSFLVVPRDTTDQGDNGGGNDTSGTDNRKGVFTHLGNGVAVSPPSGQGNVQVVSLAYPRAVAKGDGNDLYISTKSGGFSGSVYTASTISDSATKLMDVFGEIQVINYHQDSVYVLAQGVGRQSYIYVKNKNVGSEYRIINLDSTVFNNYNTSYMQVINDTTIYISDGSIHTFNPQTYRSRKIVNQTNSLFAWNFVVNDTAVFYMNTYDNQVYFYNDRNGPTPIAGTYNQRGSVDGRPGIGTLSTFIRPTLDLDGNIIFGDGVNNVENFHKLRKLDIRTGIITTLAGTGVPGFKDSENPLEAQFYNIVGIAIDPISGNVYIADEANNRIRVFRR